MTSETAVGSDTISKTQFFNIVGDENISGLSIHIPAVGVHEREKPESAAGGDCV